MGEKLDSKSKKLACIALWLCSRCLSRCETSHLSYTTIIIHSTLFQRRCLNALVFQILIHFSLWERERWKRSSWTMCWYHWVCWCLEHITCGCSSPFCVIQFELSLASMLSLVANGPYPWWLSVPISLSLSLDLSCSVQLVFEFFS